VHGTRIALITGANKGIGLIARELDRRAGAHLKPRGAAMSVKLALLDDAGPTGGFFDARGPVPW
jgi:NAD(P)-dependent dehydrogenase (short-subunit alcohol dehydrogenase family)